MKTIYANLIFMMILTTLVSCEVELDGSSSGSGKGDNTINSTVIADSIESAEGKLLLSQDWCQYDSDKDEYGVDLEAEMRMTFQDSGLVSVKLTILKGGVSDSESEDVKWAIKDNKLIFETSKKSKSYDFTLNQDELVISGFYSYDNGDFEDGIFSQCYMENNDISISPEY